ncbi:MAG: Gfo/Idh/MocA family oxidoreductase [Ilumatobacteraceae bacterium]
MIGVAIIGFGYWGPNLVRNFSLVEGAAVVGVCDPRPDRLAYAQKLYPAAKMFTSVDNLLACDEVDAVAIATPVMTHFEIARKVLTAGRHVLVEKPFTSTVAEGEELVAIAEVARLTIMVDHTFIYTSAVRKIRDLIQTNVLGTLYYYDSVRVNLGLFQSDVSVMWDLAVHDLSIMDYLVPVMPTTVAATAVSHVAGQPANMAYLTCRFADNFIAHFHVNWLAPVKIRQTLICGSDRMVVFDDVDMSEKVRVYDKGIILDEQGDHLYQRHVGYRTGDMWAPRLDNVEALAVEAEHFIECIKTGTAPLSDGRSGVRVVRILEAAADSIAANGSPIEITDSRSRA